MPRYYDVDDILAEEELVPCTTLMDFTHLAHLDPDYDRHHDDDDDHDQPQDGASTSKHFLPANSRIKVSLWAVEMWASLGFVRLSLPRHYHRRARERLEAEPSEVDLRKRNERYFLSGCALVDLVEEANPKLIQKLVSQPRMISTRTSEIAKLEAVLREARELRVALLTAYTGDRLRHTLDWSLSCVGEDATSYTDKLTEMERRLFSAGARASAQHWRWKVHGFSKRGRAGRLAPQRSASNRERDEASSLPPEGRSNRNKRSRRT